MRGAVINAEREEKGAITAFFSLSLLLIIALLTVLLESAHVGACRGIAERIMEVSVKSLLGSYSLPLYENYHIFARCIPENSEEDKALESELEWFLHQNTGGNSWLEPTFENVKIDSAVMLTESGGAAFYEQAIQYAKYQAAGGLAEWLFASADQLREAQQVGLVLQKTMRAQQGTARVEQTLLELLECVDGFKTDGSCVLRNIVGQPRMADAFVKKMAPGALVQERLVPGNKELFRAQWWHYCGPSEMIRDMLNRRSVMYGAEQEFERLREEYKKTKGKGKELEDELLAEMEVQAGAISEAQNEYYMLLSSLYSMIQTSRQKAEQAIVLIERLDGERIAARKQLQEYAEELEGDKAGLPEEIYTELKEQNDKLLSQLSLENQAGFLKDIEGMKSALLHNAEVLRNAEIKAGALCAAPVGMPWECEAGLRALESVLLGFQTDKLVFSYQDIVLSDGNGSITGVIYQLIRYGLAGLVLEEPDNISKGSIQPVDLPSAGVGEEGSWPGFSLGDLFDGQEDALFLLEKSGVFGALSRGMEEMLEQALFIEYLSGHYSDFTDPGAADSQEKSSGKDGAGTVLSGYPAVGTEVTEGLAYQLEYIVFGERHDADNLSSAISRIFLIRCAMNLLALYTSRECRLQMKQAATALVGFTGIGALVLLTELLIGMLRAAECAVTETACLARGGETEFFVQRSRQAVDFKELTVFSKSMIDRKAEAMSEEKAGGVLKSYREYLYLFLLLKEKEGRTLAAMDVAQQMVRLKYDDSFRMKNCVYSVTASAEAAVPIRFLQAAGILLPDEIKHNCRYGISY